MQPLNLLEIGLNLHLVSVKRKQALLMLSTYETLFMNIPKMNPLWFEIQQAAGPVVHSQLIAFILYTTRFLMIIILNDTLPAHILLQENAINYYPLNWRKL